MRDIPVYPKQWGSFLLKIILVRICPQRKTQTLCNMSIGAFYCAKMLYNASVY